MSSQISAVLFDADGVVQSYRPFADQCARLGWEEADYRSFLDEVFGHELFVGCLEGRRRLLPVVKVVLRSRDHLAPADEFLDEWLGAVTLPSPAAFEVIAQLRADGVTCCLATNQDLERADYMDNVLGYGRLFDHSFYSCRLGVAKPDEGYFAAALAALGRPASEVLFLDDRELNVAAARRAGLRAEVVTPGSDLAGLLQRHGLRVSPSERSARSAPG